MFSIRCSPSRLASASSSAVTSAAAARTPVPLSRTPVPLYRLLENLRARIGRRNQSANCAPALLCAEGGTRDCIPFPVPLSLACGGSASASGRIAASVFPGRCFFLTKSITSPHSQNVRRRFAPILAGQPAIADRFPLHAVFIGVHRAHTVRRLRRTAWGRLRWRRL
jgi:hypothetical protein